MKGFLLLFITCLILATSCKKEDKNNCEVITEKSRYCPSCASCASCPAGSDDQYNHYFTTASGKYLVNTTDYNSKNVGDSYCH